MKFRKLLIILCLLLSGCALKIETTSADEIPEFDGETYDIVINDNETYFDEDDLADTTVEEYSELDELGRAQVATAYISSETITDEERSNISYIKPSGWHTVRYDDLIEDKYLYNRAHLIGFQFVGNSSNVEENLITGTRYFNADEDHGMLHYEMEIREFIDSSDYHVKLRVTPIYTDDNLVADGVLMEAISVEDEGQSFELCVFIYNEQPGITIDHSDGDSYITEEETESEEEEITYILNTNTMKFHLTTCNSVNDIYPTNKEETSLSREEIIELGYDPCGNCNP